MKALSNTNDHVMALEANFNINADSHLVCIQNADDKYDTQAINIQNKPRKSNYTNYCSFNDTILKVKSLLLKLFVFCKP